ncbi:MAG: DUF4344 domain-containing metallopeptidase [Pseudorhodoplanes sp.]
MVFVAALLTAIPSFVRDGLAAPALKADRIDIRYVEPKSSEHQPVYRMVKEGKALESIREILRPLKLPRRLLLQTAGCDGESNAWYDGRDVTVCYEFLDEFWKNVADKDAPAGIAPIDTLIGPVADTFFHEVGHAVFDILRIPVLGREEDAADQFSTFLMLRFEKQEARRLIMGSAYQYKNDIAAPVVTMPRRKFANEHGMPAQRFYNLLCVAYGADPKLFGDLVEKDFLPKERAEGCEDEFKQVAYAMQTLIDPFIDRNLARKGHKRWLPPVTTRPKPWRAHPEKMMRP